MGDWLLFTQWSAPVLKYFKCRGLGLNASSSTLMSSELYCKSAHCKIFYFSPSGPGVAAYIWPAARVCRLENISRAPDQINGDEMDWVWSPEPWPLAPSSGLRVEDNKKSLAAPLARARTMADLHFLCLELISVIRSSLIISSTFGRSPTTLDTRHPVNGFLIPDNGSHLIWAFNDQNYALFSAE